MRTCVHAHIKLFRWPNLLMVFGGVLLIFEGAERRGGLDNSANIALALKLLLAFSLTLAAAWGYIINDITDIDNDRANARKRPLITGALNLQQATQSARLTLLALVLAISGMFLLPSVSITVKVLSLTAIVLVILLEWLYTKHLRRIPVLGVMTTSILVSTIVILPGTVMALSSGTYVPLPEEQRFYFMAFFLFAFLVTSAREQAKDLQDASGDGLYGKQTLPLVLGWKKARTVLTANVILLELLVIAVLYALWIAQRHNVLFFGGVFVAIPLLVMIRFTFRISEPGDAATLSGFLKFIMVSGLLSVLFI